MAFVLQRYIFRELAKVFVLATVALTTILSLGNLLRFIQKYGAGPNQVGHILLYLLPVMLTFVLPLGALFAAALAYGRLAADNEIEACKASGLSPLTLVYPGLVLAILVAIGNLVLSFHIMPLFVHRAERAIKADAKQILFRNIQRRGYYTVPGDRFTLYADYADPDTDTLYGVVVAEARDGVIEWIDAAQAAKVSLDSTDQYTEVRVTSQGSLRMGKTNEVWLAGDSLISAGARLGSMLGDRIGFKPLREMKQIEADVLTFSPVQRRARDVAAQYLTELLAQDIDRVIRFQSGYDLAGEPNGVRISAWRCEAGAHGTIQFSGEVEVTERNRSGIGRTLRCEKAQLRMEGDELAPTLTLELVNASPKGSAQVIMRYRMHGLAFPQALVRKVTTGNLLDHLSAQAMGASLTLGASADLVQRQKALDREVRKALADIRAETHSRLVFAVGCIPMILIGIGLGILKRDGHLLSAFGAACIPTLILVVAIVSGRHLTQSMTAGALLGPAIMWSGLGVLVLIALDVYRRLLRH